MNGTDGVPTGKGRTADAATGDAEKTGDAS
jgi:hypothetical protein